MKKLIPIFAILLGWAVAAWAEVPGTLTTLRQIHSLSNGEGNQKFPVAFEATVTYVRANERILFVQDEDVAVFVLIAADAKLLLPGDRIEIKGKTSGSFNPIVIPDSITVLHHGTLPNGPFRLPSSNLSRRSSIAGWSPCVAWSAPPTSGLGETGCEPASCK